jgi:hypothetical protein
MFFKMVKTTNQRKHLGVKQHFSWIFGWSRFLQADPQIPLAGRAHAGPKRAPSSDGTSCCRVSRVTSESLM